MADTVELDDETANAIGAEIAERLMLKRDREHKDRWQTSVGTKTNQGLARTVYGLFIEAGKKQRGE